MRKIISLSLFVLLVAVKGTAQTPIGALTYGTLTQPKFIIFDERLPRSTNAQAILQANLKLNPDGQYVLIQQITDQLKTI